MTITEIAYLTFIGATALFKTLLAFAVAVVIVFAPLGLADATNNHRWLWLYVIHVLTLFFLLGWGLQ